MERSIPISAISTSNELPPYEKNGSAAPVTGRTHQLRVHFAHIGHPILGDDVYGIPDKYIDRHALHAAVLSLPLPYGDEITEFISLPPEDMLNAANEYGCNLKKLFEEHFKN